MSASIPHISQHLPHTQAFKDTATALMLGSPFFANLFLRYKHIATTSIPTLAVGVKHFLYNPDFLGKLSEKERLAAFAHEVMHGVFQHVPMQQHYFESGIGPDGKPFDPETWAKAIDYCVNGAVKEAGIGQIGDNWYCDTARFPTTMTPQEIYTKLRKDSDNQNQQNQQGQQNQQNQQGQQGQQLDQHGIDGESTDGEPAVSQAAVISAARAAKAMGGDVPVCVERLIGGIIKPPSDPWALLRKYISDVSKGRDRTSMRRLDRRLITRGVGAPGRDGFRIGRVGVVVDVSGSISQRDLDLFAGHLSLILQEYKPKCVRIAWTDTTVHRLDEVQDMSQLKQAFVKPVPGGGGTDLEVAYPELGRCDVVIMLTDGYTFFKARPKFPVIWAMTTKNVAPYGKTIHI